MDSNCSSRLPANIRGPADVIHRYFEPLARELNNAISCLEQDFDSFEDGQRIAKQVTLILERILDRNTDREFGFVWDYTLRLLEATLPHGRFKGQFLSEDYCHRKQIEKLLQSITGWAEANYYETCEVHTVMQDNCFECVMNLYNPKFRKKMTESMRDDYKNEIKTVLDYLKFNATCEASLKPMLLRLNAELLKLEEQHWTPPMSEASLAEEVFGDRKYAKRISRAVKSGVLTRRQDTPGNKCCYYKPELNNINSRKN